MTHHPPTLDRLVSGTSGSLGLRTRQDSPNDFANDWNTIIPPLGSLPRQLRGGMVNDACRLAQADDFIHYTLREFRMALHAEYLYVSQASLGRRGVILDEALVRGNLCRRQQLAAAWHFRNVVAMHLLYILQSHG